MLFLLSSLQRGRKNSAVDFAGLQSKETGSNGFWKTKMFCCCPLRWKRETKLTFDCRTMPAEPRNKRKQRSVLAKRQLQPLPYTHRGGFAPPLSLISGLLLGGLIDWLFRKWNDLLLIRGRREHWPGRQSFISFFFSFFIHQTDHINLIEEYEFTFGKPKDLEQSTKYIRNTNLTSYNAMLCGTP